ncbi:MAG TPA: transglycosylase domain-containing protein [Chitinophagaceae bacterium]|nr:transglycosylase domain-containing protein [Chitinophagaceae bacterium]
MKKSVRIFWLFTFLCVGVFALVVLMANFGVFGTMPSLKELENPSMLQSSEVYADDGTLMGKYYRVNGNRSNVDYNDISKNVINALVATEDVRFYDHSGVDMKSTLRAVVLLGHEGGGSTITQQLAKALLNQGSKNKAWRVIEKIKEYITAIKLERNFTKEEILALYLNAVSFSDNVFGIRNAARTFFQKEPDRLNVPEAALLVGMVNGPGVYNPRLNPRAALDRRNLVISRMQENGYITAADAARYKTQPIDLSHYRKLDENTGYAPYFREILKDEIRTALKDVRKPDGTEYNIYDDGLRIFTTINPKMQEYAEESAAEWMPTVQKRMDAQAYIRNGSVWKGHENVLEAAMRQSDRWDNLKDDGLTDEQIRASFFKKVPMKIFAWNPKREKDTVMTPYDSIKYHRQMMQTAFMVMDPVTGEVKAWVGGISFKTYKYDHANLKTKRQVGSTIKPLLYTQAMEERGFTPETMCDNEPQFFQGNGWVPAGKKCIGPPQVTMAGALAHSLNCASAYIMKQVGPQQFADFLGRLNLPTKVDPYPSIALGACDLSLYEMLWAYSIFPGKGFSTRPYFINRIEDRNGNVLKRFDYSVNRKEAINEVTAYKMCQMMQGTVDIGTAAGLRASLGAAEMGGKTGTTNDNSDAWFMGYTPQLLAGVWIGCDDRFIQLKNNLGYGGQAAMPIWREFFRKVYNDKTLGIDRDSRFSRPADLENEINNADLMNLIQNANPGAEGEDQGAGSEKDFEIQPNQYIGPESQPVKDDQKDTVVVKPKDPRIGDPYQPADKPKKKGFLKRLFGKKEE